MTLAPDTVFGPYRVAALIGVGGMGEVYRATDTRLKRDVAIKVLPALFASDADRLARFQREAEVLASLNHVNIAHVYGLEQSGGRTALAMELVEGETLTERLRRGPLELDEALVIARQIAEALEAAHARGIVHRDLKPGNVKLTPDGVVKVLDFGIAKALDARATGAPLAPATETGLVLGTPAYMSPEQARGKSIDERADIWAFGCVLFEMLAGRPPFDDDSDVTLTPGTLRESKAAVDALAHAPPAVRRTIDLCLQADARKRIRHIGDVRLALDGAFETAAPDAGPRRGRRTSIALSAVGALVLLALAVPALRHLRESPPPETRLDVVTPPTNQPTSFALSPDGRQIVFVASGPNGSQLWLRSLAETTARPLAGTAGAVFPFWAPNNRSIGFFADGSLKRVDLGGGAPRTLAPADNGVGGTWNSDDVILFSPSLASPLMRISAAGGTATRALPLGPRESGHIGPHFLPDGVRFLFNVTGSPEQSGIHIGALDGSVATRLTAAEGAEGDAQFLPTGWLVWVRAGALVAQRLDLAQPVLKGDLLTLADGVPIDPRRRGGFSVSASGLIAYRAGGGSKRRLTWLDRTGAEKGTLGDADSEGLIQPILAPDGRRAVAARRVQGNVDLWLLDGSRRTRITFDPARDDYEQLSPDGSVIVFRSMRTGAGDLYAKLLGKTEPEEVLLRSDNLKVPTGWSPDGRFLMYFSIDPETSADLWVLPMSGDADRTPYVFLKTPFREVYGVFSPDGRWVAYHSNESGQQEVYVRPFFEPGKNGGAPSSDQWQISTDGGTYAAWRPDGRELYYLDPTGAMMAASITVTGNTVVPGTPQMLFRTNIFSGGRDVQQGRQYDVAADGRFLVNTELDDDAGAPITLIQNWSPPTTP